MLSESHRHSACRLQLALTMSRTLGSRPPSAFSDPTVPFLPGNSFSDSTVRMTKKIVASEAFRMSDIAVGQKANFRKSHAFDIRAGTPIAVDVPRKDYPAAPPPLVGLSNEKASHSKKFVLTEVCLQQRSRQNSQSSNMINQSQAEFVPAFAGLDGKVLRFEAFTSEHVPENLTQPSRVRKFTICYYLVDDSIQINEHREQNSGYAQGLFMKRHRVAKRGTAGEEFVTLFDFADTKTVMIYNREFHLTGCNGFTSEFFRVNGMKLTFEASVPTDMYKIQRATLSRMSTRSATPAILEERSSTATPDIFRPETSMSMSSVSSTKKRDMREKFLKYANKVLRFYACWDDRGSMFGERMEYILNYYLQDDKIEVLEVKRHNSGRDPFPKLVKKQRIPRHFRGVPSVGSKESDFEEEFINEQDLIVGDTIEIFGRELRIYDCDTFTREYFRQQLGFIQPERTLESEPLVEFPSLEIPPYSGFGSEPDSISSYFTLVPKQRFGFLTDPDRAMKYDTVIFRWKARFDMDQMTMPNPDDQKRRFVVSFFMGDGSVSVYEPPIQNSGFMGGKFLERQRVLRRGFKMGSGQWMDKDDFLISLPGSVWINNFPFMLMDADKFTLRYLNNGKQFVDLNRVNEKLKKAASMSADMMKAFRALDSKGTGTVSLEVLVQVLRKFSLELDEDELIALITHWDSQKTGFVHYQEFLQNIF